MVGFLLFVFAGAPMAADAGSSGGPPFNYRLNQVQLEVHRQFGHGQPSQSLSILGTGAAVLDSNRTKLTFAVDDAYLIAQLNALYKMRFFSLPEALGARQSVFLKDDGMVGTQQLRMSDAATTQVCFSVPGFRKCVRFADGDGPTDLQSWVHAAISEALQRTSAKPK